MHTEVALTVNYILSHLYNKLPRRRVDSFGLELDACIRNKIRRHWYPAEPFKDVQYRCLRVTGEHTDTVMFQAAQNCGLLVQEISSCLPDDLTIWVDPGEVSYKFGSKGVTYFLLQKGGVLDSAAPSFDGVLEHNNNALVSCMDSPPHSTLNPEAPLFLPSMETLSGSFGQFSVGSMSANPGYSPQQSISPSSSVTPSMNSYMQKSNTIAGFTAAMFAQTKFGSTKLKTLAKRPNRLSSTEIGAYVNNKHHVSRPGSLSGQPSQQPLVNRSISLSPSSTFAGNEGPHFATANADTQNFSNGFLSVQIPPQDTSAPMMAKHRSTLSQSSYLTAGANGYQSQKQTSPGLDERGSQNNAYQQLLMAN